MKSPNEKLTGQDRQELRDLLRSRGVPNNDIAHFLRDVSFSRRDVSDELRTWLKERPKAKKVNNANQN